ncbi:MAG TPA: ABC transporter permease [Solirubrobacter sp.]|nr:ABC transporter permease [Solirubrobacter sp.]
MTAIAAPAKRTNPLWPFIFKRLLVIPPALIVLVTLSFLLVSLVPGDPAYLILGDHATPDQVAKVHAQLGLDQPWLDRYLSYLGAVLHGDLGESFSTGQPVRTQILSLLPNSLVLILPGIAAAVLIGTVLGGVAAYFRRRMPDRVASLVITSTQSIPDFFIGLLLILIFYFHLHAAPPPIGALGTDTVRPEQITGSLALDAVLSGNWDAVRSIMGHAVLPVLTLGIFFSSYFAKTVRSSMTQSLASPHVEFARAIGLREGTAIGYAFHSARTPILTYAALLFGSLLGGVAIIETVFAWPGVGAWALDGVLKGDIPVIQGFVLFVGILTLFVYLALDVVVMALDPRVRIG